MIINKASPCYYLREYLPRTVTNLLTEYKKTNKK